MLGGINIAPGSSRREIEKKLEDLEKQKDNGLLTLEEYDTLRIRYERKLGNREAVSKLQEKKGFKPSAIADKKALKEELYDDFVDKYAKRDNEIAQEEASNSVGKGTKRILVLILLLTVFVVGIGAGVMALHTQTTQNQEIVTVYDSAFVDNMTISNATNTTNNTTNMTTKTTTSSKNNTYSKSSSNSSQSSYSSKSSSSYSNSSSSSSSSRSSSRSGSSSSSSSSSSSRSSSSSSR